MFGISVDFLPQYGIATEINSGITISNRLFSIHGDRLAAAGAVVVLLAAGQAGPRPRDLLLGNLLLVLQCSGGAVYQVRRHPRKILDTITIPRG